jgi:hypothetical protein
MAGDGFEEGWADNTARSTFIFTVLGVVLFVGAVFLFIF